jgi:RNase H-like domain found in reverse transcriptase
MTLHVPHCTHEKGKAVPDIVARLSQDFDDKCPLLKWSSDWEDTLVPVEWVITYWSWVLNPVETCYSATEREALAAKESLVHFQLFIEGEWILLVMDHAALTWAETYENANGRLAAWGTLFTTYPELVIVHWLGWVHSNVDPLLRLPRILLYALPARSNLPRPSMSTEHEELQQAWQVFLQKCKLLVPVKAILTCVYITASISPLTVYIYHHLPSRGSVL